MLLFVARHVGNGMLGEGGEMARMREKLLFSDLSVTHKYQHAIMMGEATSGLTEGIILNVNESTPICYTVRMIAGSFSRGYSKQFI